MTLAMLTPLLLLTQAAPASPDCDNAITQADMNQCAGQEYLAADAALNRQWEATAAQMKHRELMYDHSHEDRPGYFEVLLAAQRAWLQYRDQHCATEGYLARGGTLEPLLVANCKTELTKQRTQQLYDIEVWPE